MKRPLQLLIALTFVLLGLLFLPACGDDVEDPYTWGDVSVELSTAFCAALERCGSNIDQPVCVEHSRFHLCEPDHTCDVEMEAEAAEASTACVNAFDVLMRNDESCYILQTYGVAPEECYAVLDFRPDPRPAP